MYIASPTVEALVESAQVVLTSVSEPSCATVFYFLGEHCSVDIERLIERLNQAGISFAGGIFPSVFSESCQSSEGAVITALPTVAPPVVVSGLDAPEPDLSELEQWADVAYERGATAFTLVDGLAANIASFLEGLYDTLGNSVYYFGGGAGSLSLKQQPCLFTSQGLFQNVSVVAFIDLSISLGVQHGWERLEGPLLASKTQNNIVSQLNWKNAFEVYKSVLEKDASPALTSENFFDIAKGYPFGLLKEGEEDIVRDPIIVNEAGELVCVGEVPENASLFVLKGEKARLTKAAFAAAQMSSQVPSDDIFKTFVVDCISRVLFLGDDFVQELDAVQKGCEPYDRGLSTEGVLSLGEISSYGEGFLEWFNKTIVVGTFYSSATSTASQSD